MPGSGPTDRLAPFRFSARSRVDFSDTDAVGIVYYGRYPHYFDRAVFAYRRHLGLDLLGPPSHQYVMRALTVDYHAPARFDDPLEVFVRVARIGRTSHTIEMAVENIDGGAPQRLAEGRQVVVGLDPGTGRPSAVPADVRDRLIAFEGEGLEQA
jgi:acyl-CoA thioester hydrolase